MKFLTAFDGKNRREAKEATVPTWYSHQRPRYKRWRHLPVYCPKISAILFFDGQVRRIRRSNLEFVMRRCQDSQKEHTIRTSELIRYHRRCCVTQASRDITPERVKLLMLVSNKQDSTRELCLQDRRHRDHRSSQLLHLQMNANIKISTCRLDGKTRYSP